MSLRNLSQRGHSLVTLLMKSEPYGVRWTHSKVITPNLWITSESKLTGVRTGRPSLSNFESQGRPLTVLMVWLMSKKNAINKYTKFYLNQGYDVLTVRITPWQLLWPIGTEPVISQELIPILNSSDHTQKVIHGFSVGGYVFSRMLRHLEQNPKANEQLMSTFKGQVWDSVVDVNGISLGVSKSVFQNNDVLQKALENYIEFHLKAFHSVATKFYEQAHENYYERPLRVPALFFGSKLDQISTPDVVQALMDTWETKHGIKCESRMWSDTQHVGHMRKHTEEYQKLLTSFLSRNVTVPVSAEDVDYNSTTGQPQILYSN